MGFWHMGRVLIRTPVFPPQADPGCVCHVQRQGIARCGCSSASVRRRMLLETGVEQSPGDLDLASG